MIPDWLKVRVEDSVAELRKAAAIESRDLFVEALLDGKIQDLSPSRATRLVAQLQNLDVASPIALTQLVALARSVRAPVKSRPNI